MGRWAGTPVTRARAYWAARLPLPCSRCGKPVIPDTTKPDHGWQVDHWPIPRELGGTDTWPAHRTCNLLAGAKRGAQITNTRRNQTANTPAWAPETERKIRGW